MEFGLWGGGSGAYICVKWTQGTELADYYTDAKANLSIIIDGKLTTLTDIPVNRDFIRSWCSAEILKGIQGKRMSDGNVILTARAPRLHVTCRMEQLNHFSYVENACEADTD